MVNRHIFFASHKKHRILVEGRCSMRNIRGTKFIWIQITMVLTVMLMGSPNSAGDTYSTGDGLRINVDSTGRTESLFMD
jgi:hypothetical protein